MRNGVSMSDKVEEKIIFFDHVAVGEDINQSCLNPASILRTRKFPKNVTKYTHANFSSHAGLPVSLFNVNN